MVTMKNTAIIDKIRKILSKVENNASQHEVETALKLASELAAKHNLELSELQTDEQEDGSINIVEEDLLKMEDRSIEVQAKYTYTMQLLMDVFNVKIVYNRGGKRYYKIRVLGDEKDVAICKVLWNWLPKIMQRLYRSYLNSYGIRDCAARRNGFFEGFAMGCIKTNKAETEKYDEQTDGRYSLVVADKRTMVDQYLQDTYSNVRTRKSMLAEGSYHSTQVGYCEGQKVNLKNQLAQGQSEIKALK